MRILDRYLIRGFLKAVGFCLCLFFILFIVVDSFNNLDEFLKKSVGVGVIASYYFYLLPSLFVQLLPVAMLVAILYVLGTLNRHNEITAIKASGVGALSILSPYLFTGLVISGLVLLLNETVVPKTALTSTAILEGLIQKGKKNLDERAIQNVTLYSPDHRMIFAREYEISSQTLHDVVVLEGGTAGRAISSKLNAKKARYENGQWIFYEAMHYRENRRGMLVGEPKFSKELALEIPAKPVDFIKGPSQVEFMNTKELKNQMAKLKGQSRRRLSVDLHAKIALAFLCFVVLLIGAPLAMQTERSGAMRGVGVGVLIALSYYALHSISIALGRGGILLPFVSAWLGNIVFALVGFYLIQKTS